MNTLQTNWMSRGIRWLFGAIILVTSCSSGATRTLRTEWWLPTQAPVSGMLRYRIRTERTISQTAVPVGPTVSTCDVTISATPLGDQTGLRIRPTDSFDSCKTDSLLGHWLWYIKFGHDLNDRDSNITPTELAFGGGPILRGPWREGDRLLFSFWFFILHAEVASVDDTTIKLVFDFWGGPAVSDWRGSGELTMTNDVDGLHEAHADWSWTYRDASVAETLTITRLPSETPPAPLGGRRGA